MRFKLNINFKSSTTATSPSQMVVAEVPEGVSSTALTENGTESAVHNSARESTRLNSLLKCNFCFFHKLKITPFKIFLDKFNLFVPQGVIKIKNRLL